MRINVYGGQNIDKRRVRRHFADIGIHGLPAKFRYVFIYGIQNLLAVKVRYPHQPLGGAQDSHGNAILMHSDGFLSADPFVTP